MSDTHVRSGLTFLRMISGIFIITMILSSCTADPSPPAYTQGYNFIDGARVIYRYLSCGEPVAPHGTDPAAYVAYCSDLERKASDYRRIFIDRFTSFASREFSGSYPGNVVYPFGGSDLFAALATYPAAEMITTISLETSGDPRPLSKGDPAILSRAMTNFLSVCGRFLSMQDNSYVNIRDTERAAFPGQVSMSIMAARIHGYEPVALRFFRIDDNGAVHYYSAGDISSLESVKAPVLHPRQPRSSCTAAFLNMEISYRGTGRSGRSRHFTHRHIAANLHNGSFAGSPLERHIRGLGRFAAMTRGASYLLWRDDFSAIRNCLLDGMAVMVSDATGILPRHAKEAGFDMTAYGNFHGAFLDDNGGAGAAEFRKLFAEQHARSIDFRYGYADSRGSPHLFIYRPRDPGR